jgi:hypothetical protein
LAPDLQLWFAHPVDAGTKVLNEQVQGRNQ